MGDIAMTHEAVELREARRDDLDALAELHVRLRR